MPRVVSITGSYKCRNNETQSFESTSSEYLKKNQLLLELKEKCMSVVERQEKDGRTFSVLQWADCFNPNEEEKSKQESKVLTVHLYLERCGIENGNCAGLRQLLRIFRALVNYAKGELHMYGANPVIFETATEKMARGQFGPRPLIRTSSSNFSTLVSETPDKVCEILGIDEKMTWYTARGTFISSELERALRSPMLRKWPATAPEPSRSTTTKTPNRKGNMWIRKPLEKTAVMSTIPLLKQPKAILQKYAFVLHCMESGKLLPVPSNQKMNAYMSEIATICGLNKKLTTHCARHTFACLAVEYGMPIDVLAKILGHTNTNMTRHYAKFSEQLIGREMQKIGQIFL